jgi:hypothetical protein
VCEGIARIGVDRLNGRIARGEMVRVGCLDALPVSLGGLDKHAVGSDLPDHSADVPAQLVRHGQLAIDVIEESHIRDAEDLARSTLFGLTDGRHLRSGDISINTSGVTIGDEAVGDCDSGTGPGSNGATGTEIHVVGVRHDHQKSLDPVAVAIVKERVKVGHFLTLQGGKWDICYE